MRRRWLFVLAALLALTVQRSPAQIKFTGIRLGYLDPKGTQAGFMLSTDITAQVDESVELGASIGAFRKNYQKTTTVAKNVSPTSGLAETTVQKELEFTTFFVPIMGEAIVHFGAEDFHLFANGGLGYQMLWNYENNFVDQTKERRYYDGFMWQAGGGFQYRIGSRSAFIGEVFYHSGTVKRDEAKNTEGLPIWSEVDLSGVGLRGGLRFGLW
jgi:hypothetical protein